MKQGLTRRGLLNRGAAIAAGFAGLQAFPGRTYAQGPLAGFGPLVPDPDKILDLPKGFKYNLISIAGQLMNDGFRVPGAHDGMAAYEGPDGLTVLVRNHEMGQGNPGGSGSPYPSAEFYNGFDKTNVYDPGTQPALGGTTNVVYDTRTKTLQGHHLSLTGTIRNCAGGLTPWGTWITCEETNDRAGSGGRTKEHGYVFDVPAVAEGSLISPVPLTKLGRCSHEAIAMDPNTGIVYLTEDEGNSAFYRFLPDVPYQNQPEGASPGDSLKFGKLQALKFVNRTDPRTLNRSGAAPLLVGVLEEVEWVDLDDVENPNTVLRTQAAGKGAAIFSRGEGAWWGNNAIYIVSTNGGPTSLGQIFKYYPSPVEGTSGEIAQRAKLELFIEPASEDQFAAPDNIAIAPNGDVIVCEDGGGDEFVHGVTTSGVVYKIARNATTNGSEFAGACFSPDGTTLFVNMQGPGYTFAITGPWHRRAA